MRRRLSESSSEEPPKKRLNRNMSIGTDIMIRNGEIVTDLYKKQWRIGKSIGAGGFGEIYLASDNIKDPVKQDSEYVAKIERYDSGPLFVEINCYLRAARYHMIKQWTLKKRITDIGIPHYVASGSHLISTHHLRFLILPRYGTDLDSVFKRKNKKFCLKTVFTISIQILDILEYLHSKGFVHSDIKGSNLLLGNGKKRIRTVDKMQNSSSKYMKSLSRENNYNSNCVTCKSVNNNSDTLDNFYCYHERSQNANQIYLLDYGLASKFLKSDGSHKEYCDDQRKAHAGTVLFCSRDAHIGCTSRRSDLENLGFNILYWLKSKLPWENDTSDPDVVHTLKCTAISDLRQFLNSVLGNSYPECIFEYFRYVTSLAFDEKPDYEYCRKIFCKGLLEYGYKNDNILDFDKTVGCDNLTKKLIARKFKKQSENISRERVAKEIISAGIRQPFGINSQVQVLRKRILRSEQQNKKVLKNMKKFNWAEVLSSNPEDILRQCSIGRSRKTTESSDSGSNETNLLNMDLTDLNPTYAMVNVINRLRDRINGIVTVPSVLNYKKGRGDGNVEKYEGYTEAMKLVLYRKNINTAQEKLKVAREKKILKSKISRKKIYNNLGVVQKMNLRSRRNGYE